MTHRQKCFLAIVVAIAAQIACASQEQVTSNKAESPKADVRTIQITEVIKPFFELMGRPKPMDWLSTFREPGQTFEEYVRSAPTPPSRDQATIYVLPLEEMKRNQISVVKATAGYLEAFYGLRVTLLPSRRIAGPLRSMDIRVNRITQAEQVRTGFITDEMLPPIVPADAAMLVAFTNKDLFPDNSMSFVFGQANPEKRTAVLSLFRLDDNASAKTVLRRTIKIAAHETGHLFSMRHCTKYVCLMSGTNHLRETDSHPIDACPECTAKICWLLKRDAVQRYNRLRDFCERNGLKAEAIGFQQKAVALATAYSDK